jgi:hypothetical protein
MGIVQVVVLAEQLFPLGLFLGADQPDLNLAQECRFG